MNENAIKTLKFIQSKLKLHEETLLVLQELIEGVINSTISSTKLAPLIVTMPDCRIIARSDGIDTFIDVIESLGVERVKKEEIEVNGIPLISDTEYPGSKGRKKQKKRGSYYYVRETNTITKEAILNDIAKRLGEKIEIISNPNPKNQKKDDT